MITYKHSRKNDTIHRYCTDIDNIYPYHTDYRYRQALEGEKGALRLELQQKYATASEELKALSEEKLAADETCSRLRQEASKLEERSVLASSELEVREKKHCFCRFCIPGYMGWHGLRLESGERAVGGGAGCSGCC